MIRATGHWNGQPATATLEQGRVTCDPERLELALEDAVGRPVPTYPEPTTDLADEATFVSACLHTIEGCEIEGLDWPEPPDGAVMAAPTVDRADTDGEVA
jgi:hypothetical protein